MIEAESREQREGRVVVIWPCCVVKESGVRVVKKFCLKEQVSW